MNVLNQVMYHIFQIVVECRKKGGCDINSCVKSMFQARMDATVAAAMNRGAFSIDLAELKTWCCVDIGLLGDVKIRLKQ